MLAGRAVFLRAAIAAAAFTISSDIVASRTPVSIGRITTRAPETAALKPELESAVKRELGRIDLSSVRARDKYVLSASLVKLQTVKSGDQIETSCVVSATLSRAGSGALHAVLQGRARAIDAPSAHKTAERAALDAAVKGAMRRLPEALR